MVAGLRVSDVDPETRHTLAMATTCITVDAAMDPAANRSGQLQGLSWLIVVWPGHKGQLGFPSIGQSH
jgi:hypothetical protein